MQQVGPTEFRIIKAFCWSFLAVVAVLLYTFFGLYLLGDAQTSSQLYNLAKVGDQKALASLLEQSASPDTLGTLRWVSPAMGRLLKSESPIFAAADEGHTAIVERLLKAGAATAVGAAVGPWGSVATESALRSAAGNGHTASVELLLKAGAAPDLGTTVGPFGMIRTDTPLQWASKKGHVDIVELLLKAGATVDMGVTVGPFGMIRKDTPLQSASRKGHAAIVELLLDAGATHEVAVDEIRFEAAKNKALRNQKEDI